MCSSLVTKKREEYIKESLTTIKRGGDKCRVEKGTYGHVGQTCGS